MADLPNDASNFVAGSDFNLVGDDVTMTPEVLRDATMTPEVLRDARDVQYLHQVGAAFNVDNKVSKT